MPLHGWAVFLCGKYFDHDENEFNHISMLLSNCSLSVPVCSHLLLDKILSIDYSLFFLKHGLFVHLRPMGADL